MCYSVKTILGFRSSIEINPGLSEIVNYPWTLFKLRFMGERWKNQWSFAIHAVSGSERLDASQRYTRCLWSWTTRTWMSEYYITSWVCTHVISSKCCEERSTYVERKQTIYSRNYTDLGDGSLGNSGNYSRDIPDHSYMYGSLLAPQPSAHPATENEYYSPRSRPLTSSPVLKFIKGEFPPSSLREEESGNVNFASPPRSHHERPITLLNRQVPSWTTSWSEENITQWDIWVGSTL